MRWIGSRGLLLVAGLTAATPAWAQLPDAPGSSPMRDGGGGRPPEAGTHGKVTREPEATGGARDTIDVLRRARSRASGTPVPEPTPSAD
jgi:hypothetical protein